MRMRPTILAGAWVRTGERARFRQLTRRLSRSNADGYHQAMESVIAKVGIAVVKPALTQWGGANKQRDLPRL
jgi:hypothetical protein